jgi:hypothetical protein
MSLTFHARRGRIRNQSKAERRIPRRRTLIVRLCRREILSGVVAGAVGTTALNLATYLDMAVRPRPASTTPEQTVRRVEELVHLTLSSKGPDSGDAADRRAGLGGLLGIAAGLSVGMTYGLLRPKLNGVPRVLLGIGAGMIANVCTSGPMALLGVTDPRTWTATSWASDLIPHLAYGFATAEAFERLFPSRLAISTDSPLYDDAFVSDDCPHRGDKHSWPLENRGAGGHDG